MCIRDSINAEYMGISRSLSEPKKEEIEEKAVELGNVTHPYTLFLDLDETLLLTQECTREEVKGEIKYSVQIRPFALSLLEQIAPLFELVIFTAASREYAIEVLKYLDPDNKFFKKVLCRESCIELERGIIIKDLRIIKDRKQSSMLIADNHVINFAFQLDNGIPVSSFDGDDDDNKLIYLLDYLKQLATFSDAVSMNKEHIGLRANQIQNQV
eukprot:TRINITY_DN43192_c0_g1_i1.p1 TRINITY_DN43192_c0_g1~~TRINITY_DN43192_c0_g1_i1.p1  ORF type:complete len:213 (+),score=30.34 TRINITY_DN43192_c0_g1_i1:151-789(+)